MKRFSLLYLGEVQYIMRAKEREREIENLSGMFLYSKFSDRERTKREREKSS